jgi:heme/copper-type cytochrome/quinol oxidase subunit 3
MQNIAEIVTMSSKFYIIKFKYRIRLRSKHNSKIYLVFYHFVKAIWIMIYYHR